MDKDNIKKYQHLQEKRKDMWEEIARINQTISVLQSELMQMFDKIDTYTSLQVERDSLIDLYKQLENEIDNLIFKRNG
jgi:hypothetical protein